VYLEHLIESLEKMYIMRAYVYSVYTTIAVALNRLIFAMSVERQVDEETF
jgi:hypothetical protein